MAIGAVSAATRSIFRSSAVRNAASRVASEAKAARSPFHTASRSPLGPRIFRCPAELSACVESLQPYHTATASALMTSMLTVAPRSFGWLSEAVNDDV
ncbi:protein NUCLEAR FUSION DEFECTIVE 6, chloroplastic/mitochondrial-like isoform X2 [Ipomoea triloba]|uniref:protein NUCLEAR FUSION DEFECTIVE 6, chloroplastic/mitochondrial-like isoform X2 n=1 Tax=Ipomoea triloba TaxID=35885 RepID=UPI00125E5985|nr:protein NUCLEAR FUSION DEFECTIVE 6, chloroplastic/mitochondrial-like isoform X2 [Ipomoea triloba]XP_031092981.1 protein NUCLEAR FUSION DEFECTIVE 6, chloroplastic/mitochondrial-like isoform X2 [Ipomoea triloba]